MADANGRTVGEILRAKREEKKMSVMQAHTETKISVEMIEALEDDDYSSFPSEIHLKGFLRNYAQLLDLDANILWSSLGRRGSASAEGASTVWEDEEGLEEEKLTSPRIIGRIVLPVLIIIILVLTTMLVRENRKVRGLTTGAVAPIVGDGVTLVVGRQV